ncbi:hypothetical protein ACOJBM_01260 [Rhizobium beringeri]
MRVLNDRDLPLPRRDRFGELRWARATVSAVARILKNPRPRRCLRLWTDPLSRRRA